MNNQNNLSQEILLPSQELPLTMISMDEWVVIKLTGIDTLNFLQTQLTCDVKKLKKQEYTFAAHCNANGKTISNICLFYFQDGIAYIERASVYKKQINAIKKYAIFSKINIKLVEDISILGITGLNNNNLLLKKTFTTLPNKYNKVINTPNNTMIYFDTPSERILIITKKTEKDKILKKINKKIQIKNSKQWISLDIEAGYPIIDDINSEKFLPQEINLKKINGISFNKGCYIGQEIIAKKQYIGNIKRSLFWLEGYSNYIPMAGDNLEVKKTNGSWKTAGIILTACKIKNKILWVQAVMNKQIILTSSIFKTKKDRDSYLTNRNTKIES